LRSCLHLMPRFATCQNFVPDNVLDSNTGRPLKEPLP
jgi:hypothetical protein